eukprot:1784354-Amphidinium_carterae.1
MAIDILQHFLPRPARDAHLLCTVAVGPCTLCVHRDSWVRPRPRATGWATLGQVPQKSYSSLFRFAKNRFGNKL